LRATPANLDTLLSRYATGDVVEMLSFRRDELMRFEVKLATRPPIKFSLDINQKGARAVQQLRRGWLGRSRSATRRR
jgi:predicted metalloprotease with PDZ domain